MTIRGVSEAQFLRLAARIREYGGLTAESGKECGDVRIAAAIDEILGYCRRDDIPPDMEFTVISVAGDRLAAESKRVSSLTQGDSSVSYSYAEPAAYAESCRKLNAWRRVT